MVTQKLKNFIGESEMKKNLLFLFGVLGLLIITGCPTPTDPTPDDLALSSAKEIITFSFASSASTGVITGTDIVVTVPYGTDATTLVAIFTTTGTNVFVSSTAQTSGITANDFTNTVTYTITADDNTTQDYTVTVIIPEATEDSGFGSASSPGDSGVLTLLESSETITMIYVNSQTNSITFPTGTDDLSTGLLATKYFMGETEVTNAVISAVLQWAYENSRFSSTIDDHNVLDTTTAKYGGQQLINLDDPDCRVDYNGLGSFSVENGYENKPVTNVTWYGSVIFCNWLTEMRDGNTNNVVYTGIDTNWMDDETTETVTKTGYRLPSRDEWEYAARYRGADATNTVDGYTDPYYTQGDSASDATADKTDATASQAVAVYDYTGSNPYSEAQTVKSLGADSANSLGIYDMTGNVYEWCFTKNNSFRVCRGGGWHSHYLNIGIGDWGSASPDNEYPNWGFRLCRTVN